MNALVKQPPLHRALAGQYAAGGEILGAGPGGPLPAPSPWTNASVYLSYPGGVVLGQAAGGNQGNGTLNAQQIFVNGVPFSPGNTTLDAGTF